MRRTHFAAVIVLSLGACFCANEAPAQGKKPDPKKKDTYKQYMKQLHARFEAWDKNNDNVLDKEELARAFRGADAKPYDARPKGKDVVIASTETFPVRVKPRVSSLAVAVLPLGCPANYAVAELMTWKRPKASTKIPAPAPPPVNVAVFPDFQFLSLIKANGDRISRKEFDKWATDYAKLIDQFDDARDALKASQGKLAKAKTAQAKKQAAAEAQRHQTELDRAVAQLNTIPAAIHKALNVRP